jgi:integrase
VAGDGPENVTKALILAYRLHLQERGHTRLVGQPLQHTSLVASQRALRTFFAWAEEEGYVIDGRILKLRKTRVPQKDATVYTLTQMDVILAACASPTEELAIRLLVGTGVRLSEAVGVCLRGPDGLPDLETDNLDRGCATLRVRWDAGAKGLKTRRTPVAVPLMKAIRRYELRERPRVTPPQCSSPAAASRTRHGDSTASWIASRSAWASTSTPMPSGTHGRPSWSSPAGPWSTCAPSSATPTTPRCTVTSVWPRSGTSVTSTAGRS